MIEETCAVCIYYSISSSDTCHSGVSCVSSEMPSGAVDIIINALDSHDNKHLRDQSWYQGVVEWTKTHRASVLSIDPPCEGVVIDTKWSLSIALPLSLPKSAGKMYLCDLGIPSKVYSEIGIKYASPFGSKYVIPLHYSE